MEYLLNDPLKMVHRSTKQILGRKTALIPTFCGWMAVREAVWTTQKRALARTEIGLDAGLYSRLSFHYLGRI